MTTITEEMLTLDIALDRRRLAQMSLEESNQLLARLERMQQALSSEVASDTESLSAADLKQEKALKVAVFRLCSDLTEEILLHAVDMAQDKQHSIDFLNQQLRKKLKEQYLANQLLSRAQSLREQTHQRAEASGMGVIL